MLEESEKNENVSNWLSNMAEKQWQKCRKINPLSHSLRFWARVKAPKFYSTHKHLAKQERISISL